MNTRPVVLVLLLLVLIITSQFEWKQQIGDAADADPAAARRRQQLLAREDAVKEKVRAQATWPGFLFSCSPWAYPGSCALQGMSELNLGTR